MDTATLLLNRLKAKQAEFATQALSRPDKRDAFEYGFRVGVVDGFNQAINELLTILDEERNDNNRDL
jgi:hypothetical protein